MNLTHVSHSARRQEQQLELKELEDEGEGGEPDHTDLLMEQAIRFMMIAFQTLKACKSYAKGAVSEVCQT